MEKNYKYAALIFDPISFVPEASSPIVVDNDVYFISKNLTDSLQSEEIKHWKEWLGTIQWENIEGQKSILYTKCETNTPAVLDSENKALESAVYNSFRTLPKFNFTFPPDRSVLITGSCLSKDGIEFTDIRSFTEIDAWQKSGYYHAEYNEFDWQWRKSKFSNFFKEWGEFNNQFKTLIIREKARQLIEASRSFEQAFQTNQLEFKLPNLVRAVECFIDFRRRDGFVEKTIHFIGKPREKLPYDITSSNFEEMLLMLYEVRIDCSHGKPIEWSLNRKGITKENELNDKFIQLEFLAEFCARAALKRGLFDVDLQVVLHCRARLEKAWIAGEIKSSN